MQADVGEEPTATSSSAAVAESPLMTFGASEESTQQDDACYFVDSSGNWFQFDNYDTWSEALALAQQPMPPPDLGDLQDDSGMDLDSEIPLMYSIDSHGGIQLEPPLNFASIEFNRQSGKRMRTNRGILPFDIQDYAASNALPSALPAANPATTKFPYIKSKASGSVTGPYEDSIIEHVSLNPRREAWTLPADSMPYRDPAHKGPASGACQPYNHLKPLNDFDNGQRLYKQDRCSKQRNNSAHSSRRERKRQIAEDLAIAAAVSEYNTTKHHIDVKAK
jgi:hypothetical protein